MVFIPNFECLTKTIEIVQLSFKSPIVLFLRIRLKDYSLSNI